MKLKQIVIGLVLLVGLAVLAIQWLERAIGEIFGGAAYAMNFCNGKPCDYYSRTSQPNNGFVLSWPTLSWPTPVATPDTMIFQDYGLNTFAEVGEGGVSTFAVDVSGSMDREDRLELVKQSLLLLLDNLRPTDQVALVMYGDEAGLVLPPTLVGERATLREAINALQPEGSTNAEAGLRLGYQVARQGFVPGHINRVILCSDGVANVGVTEPVRLTAQVRHEASRDIHLVTLGFGMGNFNDVLMERLANNGNGFYAYIDDLPEARRVFEQNLTGTLQTIALDAKIQVTFNPQVVSRYRLLGYENRAVADQDFRNDAVDAGEIGAGHTVTALYALVLQPNAQGRLATVSVRWQDPDTREVTELNGNLNTWDLAGDFRTTSARYQLSVLAAHYAEILRGSPWVAHLRLADLLPHTRWLAGQLAGDPAVAEFAQLVERAAQLSR